MHPKVAYIKALIIQSDLNYIDGLLRHQGENPLESFRHLRHLFVFLDNFRDLLDKSNQLVRHNQTLTQKKREIRNRLKQVGHLRNKVGGHLDEEVLNAVIDEEPILFSSDINPDGEYAITSIRLLDMALNTHTDSDGKPAIFGHDIDLVYPPDNREFLGWMEELVESALEVTGLIMQEIDSQIDRVESNKELMKQYIEVGLGTFSA